MPNATCLKPGQYRTCFQNSWQWANIEQLPGLQHGAWKPELCSQHLQLQLALQQCHAVPWCCFGSRAHTCDARSSLSVRRHQINPCCLAIQGGHIKNQPAFPTGQWWLHAVGCTDKLVPGHQQRPSTLATAAHAWAGHDECNHHIPVALEVRPSN